MRMELVVSCHYHQPHEYRHFGLAAKKEKKVSIETNTLWEKMEGFFYGWEHLVMSLQSVFVPKFRNTFVGKKKKKLASSGAHVFMSLQGIRMTLRIFSKFGMVN